MFKYKMMAVDYLNFVNPDRFLVEVLDRIVPRFSGFFQKVDDFLPQTYCSVCGDVRTPVFYDAGIGSERNFFCSDRCLKEFLDSKDSSNSLEDLRRKRLLELGETPVGSKPSVGENLARCMQ